MVIREDRMATDLAHLADTAGIVAATCPRAEDWPAFLDDPALERAAHAAYLRDYATFGFAEPA